MIFPDGTPTFLRLGRFKMKVLHFRRKATGKAGICLSLW